MSNTKNYFGTRKGVVRFVRDQLTTLKPDSALTMIITHDLSEGYSVPIVIEGSLADIERLVEKSYLKQQLSTSPDPILAM